MGRKIRIFLPNNPQHIKIQAQAQVDLFPYAEDRQTFLTLLMKSANNTGVGVAAYALGSQTVHLLLLPEKQDSIIKCMQTLMRTYTRTYNKKYDHTGTLYQGRYKNSLIESEFYLLDTLQFIETLPTALETSLPYHTGEKQNKSLVPLPQYQALGKTTQQQQAAYRKRLLTPLPQDRVTFIQTCIDTQKITARPSFIKQLEQLIGASLFVKKRGRPPKNPLKERKMSQNFTVLSKESHKDLKIKPLQDLNFAKELVSIPLLVTEVPAVAKDFPVVFTVDDNQQTNIVALVSLGGESLAINEEGKWITEYVPANLRKHPFALASTEEQPDQKIVLIDEDSTTLSLEEGQLLFDEAGEATDALNHAIEFLKSFDQQAQVTQGIANEINQAGILIDQEISVDSGDTTQVLVSGFKVVDREKLNALDDAQLADWTRRGIIGLIENHLKSLENVNKLFTLASQKQA